jgi:hypothetical protein
MREIAVVLIVIAGIVLAGCTSSSKGPGVEGTATVTGAPQNAVIGSISFTVVKYELENSYQCNCTMAYCSESSKIGLPPEGAKFLGVYVRGENVGEVAHELPDPYEVKLVYKGTTISDTSPCKSLFTNELGRERYVGGKIYPGVSREGWIFYEVPLGFDETQAQIYTMGNYWGLPP